MSLLQLAFTFFYIGLFTIGGGQVAITLMQQSLVSTGVISQAQFYNMVAISESTPGPIGINMATYIGYKLYGVPGALIVTGAQVLPSIVIILIIARFLKSFNDNTYVKDVFIIITSMTLNAMDVWCFLGIQHSSNRNSPYSQLIIVKIYYS
ncbi:MAG: chromate transporter [Clostridia bacterium]|nr:chromate transporter [Clostridia bacterium]